MGNVDAHTYARQLTVMPSGEKVGVYGKVVMLVLAHYASPLEGIAWPSGERLAIECGMPQSTLSRTLKHLADGGCIKSVKRRRGGGHYWDVLYGVRQTPALDPEVFAFAQEAKAAQIELLSVEQKQPTPIRPAFAPGANLVLPVEQNPYEDKEKNTRVSQGARNSDALPMTVGSSGNVAARAETSVAQGSAQIRLPTNVGQARGNYISPAGPASGIAEAPVELQPYLDALDHLASVGPLTGRQNTATCRDRRLREVRRLYVAKVPPTALAGYDAIQPAPILADAFADARAVQWALTEHGPVAAQRQHPTANRQSRLANLQAERQRSMTSGQGDTGATRQLPGVVADAQRGVSGFPRVVSRQLPDARSSH